MTDEEHTTTDEQLHDAVRSRGQDLGIPDELLHAAPTSAEAFAAWLAPRRAAYEAARDRYADLGRFIAEHGRIWLTDTGDERPVHEHALDLLEQLRALLTGMDTSTALGAHNLAENGFYLLEQLRRMVLTHQDWTDPDGADARARARRQAPPPAPDTVATTPHDAYRSDL